MIRVSPSLLGLSSYTAAWIVCSDFIWDFGKLPFLAHLGKYIIKNGKISTKIHKIGKIKTIFGLGMTPILGVKNGQIKSLVCTCIIRFTFKPLIGIDFSVTLRCFT